MPRRTKSRQTVTRRFDENVELMFADLLERQAQSKTEDVASLVMVLVFGMAIVKLTVNAGEIGVESHPTPDIHAMRYGCKAHAGKLLQPEAELRKIDVGADDEIGSFPKRLSHYEEAVSDCALPTRPPSRAIHSHLAQVEFFLWKRRVVLGENSDSRIWKNFGDGPDDKARESLNAPFYFLDIRHPDMDDL